MCLIMCCNIRPNEIRQKESEPYNIYVRIFDFSHALYSAIIIGGVRVLHG